MFPTQHDAHSLREFDAFFRAQIKQNRELVKAADVKPH